jgi:hypothetical protein
MWLTPCPEAQIMLLDWARTYPVAGGFSSLLTSMINSVLSGDLFTAKKLAFAQQLATGTTSSSNTDSSDSSESSGNAAVAAESALITARNAVAVAEVAAAFELGCNTVAIMYGWLHARDMHAQIQSTFDMECVATRWNTAWDVPISSTTAQTADAQLTVKEGPQKWVSSTIKVTLLLKLCLQTLHANFNTYLRRCNCSCMQMLCYYDNNFR